MTTTTDWARLSHAYGSAEDIPGLLDRIEAAPSAELWNGLWSALCHQGSVYSASFAALPRLGAIAAARAGAERVSALVLAGSIMAAAGPGEAARARAEHPEALTGLLGLARTQLRLPAPDMEYVYLTESALALEGVPVWGEGDALSWALTGGECDVSCPGCEAAVQVVLGDAGHFTTAVDHVWEEPVDKVPLRPAQGAHLDGVGRRLYEAALADGRPRVAAALTYFFGNGVCPGCGAEFGVARAAADS